MGQTARSAAREHESDLWTQWTGAGRRRLCCCGCGAEKQGHAEKRDRDGWNMRGTIVLDREKERVAIDFDIDARSVDSGSNLRDRFLQGEPMLDAERHPLIHFHSTRLTSRNGQLARIEGALTLRGVTQDVTLTVTRLACGNNSDDASGLDCQAHATTTIRRSAFGMDSFAPFLGDEVDLQFAIVAHRTADAITGR